MRLQTIEFPKKETPETKELYVHLNGNWLEFDGYFNLFYIEKRKKYSDLEGLRLKIRGKGVRGIRLMHNRNILKEYVFPIDVPIIDDEFSFPYEKHDKGVFWFAVRADNMKSFNISGWYEGITRHAAGGRTADVRVAAIICTYQRESYVYQNLKCLKRVLEQPEWEMKRHLEIYLVDNGRTLKNHAQISQLIEEYPENIFLFENKNAGGAGGFSRGMLEVLNRKADNGLTHVLLMDDDAVFKPELFVRLYGFLSILKESYKDLTVGGNLMREDFPYLQHAGGEVFRDFKIHNEQVLMDLRSYENCVQEFMCSPEVPRNIYSGWWCCCFSLNTVRENNLPIPFFLHFDDIEYCLRNNRQGIVFLNGIGVWHKGFEWNFAGANRYYDVRNSLITAAIHQPDLSPFAVKKWVWRNMVTPFLEFRYGESDLAYRGFLDFCKGPEWLLGRNPDRLNQKVRRHFALKPLDELQGHLTAAEYEQVIQQVDFCKKQTGIQQIRDVYSPARRKGRFFKKLTWNGWFLPPKKEQGISVVSAVDVPYKAFRKQRIVLFEPSSGKALLVKRDYRELGKLLIKLLRVNRLVNRVYGKTACEYRERLNEITSASAWEKYLGLDDYE